MQLGPMIPDLTMRKPQQGLAKAQAALKPASGKSFAESLSHSSESEAPSKMAPSQPPGDPMNSPAPAGDSSLPDNTVVEAQKDNQSYLQDNSPKVADQAKPHLVKKSTVAGPAVPMLTAKQSIMMKFMRNMEAQVGVKPEQVVQAMADLDPHQLMRSPESTMNQVLNQLKLSKAQRAKAEVLYQRMLDDTAEASVKEAEIGETKSVPVELLDLKGSLGKMDDHFFLQKEKDDKNVAVLVGAGGVATMPFAHKPAATSKVDQSALANHAHMAKVVNFFDKLNVPVSHTAAPGKDGVNVNEDKFFGAQASYMPNASESAALQKSNVYTSKQAAAANAAVSIMSTGQAQKAVLQPQVNQSPNEMAMAAAGGAQAMATKVMPKPSLANQNMNADSDSDGDSFTKMQKTDATSDADSVAAGGALHQLQTANGPDKASQATPIAVTPQNVTVTKTDQLQNIHNILQKAQFLVHHGGGEMKVQLHPEGLGQVHLKVHVNNGQVSIQMLTQNQDAKKSLENGWRDLHDSLAAQKLNLNSLHVEVAREPSADMGHQAQQQMQQQMQHQLARQMARNFMGNFRDERQSRRNDFMEAGFPMRPVTNYAKPSIQSTTSSSRRSDRLLNLVA